PMMRWGEGERGRRRVQGLRSNPGVALEDSLHPWLHLLAPPGSPRLRLTSPTRPETINLEPLDGSPENGRSFPMANAAIDEILQGSAQLRDGDRGAREKKPTDRFEREGRAEAQDARRHAAERGIGQAEIDQAVRELRRGE